MAGAGRRHDRLLLDSLEALSPEAFSGPVWRVTSEGRDPLRGSTSSGRWAAPETFCVLYTSLADQGAIAEIGFRLSLEPVWPSRLRHELHSIDAETSKTLRFADLNALQPHGVDTRRFGTFDYAATQAIGAAAYFLEFDGLIVPSARASALNVVLFTDRLEMQTALTVIETKLVDWDAWRLQQRRKKQPQNF